MCHTMEIHCFKLCPELLFTKYGFSYFMKTKKKKKRIVGFRKTFFIALLLATHADVKLLLYFGWILNEIRILCVSFGVNSSLMQTP